ncbi:hypothetical protein ABZP36_005536, partial [Zizania latifolia]
NPRWIPNESVSPAMVNVNGLLIITLIAVLMSDLVKIFLRLTRQLDAGLTI